MKVHWSPILRLSLLVAFLAHPSPSRGAAIPQLLTPTNQTGDRPPEHRATIIRQRTVLVNLPALRGTNNGRLLLELFGREVELDRKDLETPRPDTLIWYGQVAGQPGGFAILTLVRDVLIGHIVTQNGYRLEFYEIRYRGHGVHALVQLDQSRYAKDEPPDEEPVPRATGPQPEGAGDVPPTCSSDPASDIDLLVLYTPAARVGAGGSDAVEGTIYTAVYETNLSYLNSDIAQRLRIVQIEEVPYTEVDVQIDKLALQDPSDGVLDQVRSMRDTYSADVVALFVEYPDTYKKCGDSFVMKDRRIDFEDKAYCVVVRDCVLTFYTLAHELGHIMGARHDWYVDDTNLSPYTYNHGYVAIAPHPVPHAFQTVMAYDDLCTDSAISPDFCPRTLYWSNPCTKYPAGDPDAVFLGVAPDPPPCPGAIVAGDGARQPKRADNHLTLNTTAITVANFRCSSRGTNNVWMKDTWNDTGEEPDPRTAAEDMWKSPSIWVRRSKDVDLVHQHQHQDPALGAPSWIYVKLQNGASTVANGTLEVYESNASPSMSWPTDWRLAGSVPVSTLANNSVRVVELPWTPSSAGHHCLLARWVSPADPMHTPETADVQANVRENNNIAWRNLFVTNLNTAILAAAAAFDIRNAGGAGAATRLVVRSATPAGQAFLRGGGVTLSPDDVLVRAWREGGTRSGGLHAEGGLLRVTDSEATLDRLILPPGGAAHVQVKFERPSGAPRGDFVIDFVQYAIPAGGEAAPRLVGGVSYEIHTGDATARVTPAP
jgi:Metallo-peptidase family M12B Reprolysin-like